MWRFKLIVFLEDLRWAGAFYIYSNIMIRSDLYNSNFIFQYFYLILILYEFKFFNKFL